MSGQRAQVHFEVFIKRKPSAPWSLEAATEDRQRAVEQAEELLAAGGVSAVRVCKETLDPDTREFATIDIFNKGLAVTTREKPAPQRDAEPPCVTPQDLYTVHARDRIGRLLDGWLRRMRATPFELLHRPDLAEKLEASGVELQHAIQKIAIPDAQDSGASVHSVIRSYTGLVERAMERLIRDGRKKVFPDLSKDTLAIAAARLMGEPERHYLLGGAVAAVLAEGVNWETKTGLLLDLAVAAPEPGPAEEFVFQVLEQPLAEILGSRAGLADVLGPDLDLGGSCAALTRLVARRELDGLLSAEPELGRFFPELTGAAVRLAGWFERERFKPARTALCRRILSELTGPRRLRPGDAAEEIELLRALALALTTAAATTALVTVDEVQAAFVERSRRLITADFVEAYLGQGRSALDEATALARLAENVAGAANKRVAARWLNACVGALRFETELRASPDSPLTKLQALANLQNAIRRIGLDGPDAAAASRALGQLGGQVETDAKLIAAVGRSPAPPVVRLTLLLRLASGTAGPLGPAAERAKGEAFRLLREPSTKTALAGAPEVLGQVRTLLDAAQAA
jgi:hypothetical protein